jgi:RNA polymerase-binding transcription factor DksA
VNADRSTATTDAAFLKDRTWLESQRQTLLVERAQYLRSAESLAAEAASLMADREPGDVQFDEESGEGDTLAVERDRDLALSAAARRSVEQIDKALARIAEGTYGICVVGGDIIPKERLEAIPEASVCVVHKVQSFT